jgi:hypothetical protein
MTSTTTTAIIACMVCPDRFATVAESMEHDHLKSNPTPAAQAYNEHFEEIWEAENNVYGERASVAFAKAGTPLFVRDHNARNLALAKKRLSDMIDALTLDQLKAYGEYRKGIFAEIASTRGN